MRIHIFLAQLSLKIYSECRIEKCNHCCLLIQQVALLQMINSDLDIDYIQHILGLLKRAKIFCGVLFPQSTYSTIFMVLVPTQVQIVSIRYQFTEIIRSYLSYLYLYRSSKLFDIRFLHAVHGLVHTNTFARINISTTIHIPQFELVSFSTAWISAYNNVLHVHVQCTHCDAYCSVVSIQFLFSLSHIVIVFVSSKFAIELVNTQLVNSASNDFWVVNVVIELKIPIEYNVFSLNKLTS